MIKKSVILQDKFNIKLQVLLQEPAQKLIISVHFTRIRPSKKTIQRIHFVIIKKKPGIEIFSNKKLPFNQLKSKD